MAALKRLYAFVPIGLKANGNTFCKNNWSGGNAELNTFNDVQYQTLGVTTHYAANVALTKSMIDTVAPLQALVGAFWAIVDIDTYALIETNIVPALSKIGKIYKWAEAEADTGLTVLSIGA